MLDPAVVDEVMRLLAEGRWSKRKIARMTGVSRGSVQGIASGRRAVRTAPPPDEKKIFKAMARRCPGCGRWMQIPVGAERCLACQAAAGPDVRLGLADEAGPCRLDLPPDEELQARFRRARRRTLLGEGIDPEAAGLIDENAVAEKQRRVSAGDPLDPRLADDETPPTAEDLAHLD